MSETFGWKGLVEHGRKFPTTYHEWTRPKLASRCHGMLLPRTTMTYGQRKNHQCWSIGHANQPLAFPSFSNASLSSSLPQARVNAIYREVSFFKRRQEALTRGGGYWNVSRIFSQADRDRSIFEHLLVSKSCTSKWEEIIVRVSEN